jgi:hypothetical protein
MSRPTPPDRSRLAATVDAVLAVEPQLSRAAAVEVVTAVAPRSGQLTWLARQLQAVPDCLASGASTVPPLAAKLIWALRAAGATQVVPPRCSGASGPSSCATRGTRAASATPASRSATPNRAAAASGDAP